MLNAKGSVPVLVVPLILIVLVVVGLIFFKGEKNGYKPSEAILLEEQANNGEEQCYSQNFFKSLVEGGFAQEAGLSQNTDPGLNINRGISNLMSWRRAGDEPFVQYPRQTGILYEYSDHTLESVSEAYKSKMEPLLFAKGYVKDSLNSSVVEQSEEGPFDVGRGIGFGYVKGNTILQVGIGEKVVMDNEPKTVHFSMSCAKKDNQYDQIYTDIIFSKAGNQLLKESAGEGDLKDMSMGIWGIHQNNIVQMNIGSVNWLSGHSAWFHKREGNWEVFFTGQERPSCEELEKRGIEAGIRCWRGEESSVTKGN